MEPSDLVSRPNERALARPPQDSLGYQAAEGLFARGLINSPQTLRLREGDVQAWHLRVFGLNLVHERPDRLTWCDDPGTRVGYRHDASLFRRTSGTTGARSLNAQATLKSTATACAINAKRSRACQLNA